MKTSSKLSISHPKKLLFLLQFPKLLTTALTARAIGVNESTVYRWLEKDKEFKKAMQEIKKKIDSKRLEEAEVEIHRRGLDKSDLLLIFETKALDPDRYRERVPDRVIGDITVKLEIPRREYPQLKEG